MHRYWTSECPNCPIKAECTPGDYRRITRWEHEDILDIVQERLDGAPEAMRLRRQSVEHVFGTLKSWMGSTHFLTRTLPKIATEMSSHVLAQGARADAAGMPLAEAAKPPCSTAVNVRSNNGKRSAAGGYGNPAN